jgi:uncharacterized protein (TIGR02646 family)
MIKLERSPGPKQLIDPADDVGLERTEAIKFYQALTDAKNEFSFKIYRQPYVKSAIEQIFSQKCAYCETRYIVTQPVDVEHFRPKGAVKVGKKKRVGYYWLASEWTNLLPSCIRCNRSNTYLMPKNKKVTMGKANFFPLEDETKRASQPGEESNEEPLLLNPCHDDPAQHLKFTEDGAVQPTMNSKGEPSAKGERSIQIYALCRPELVEERAKYAKLILAQIVRVTEALANIQKYPNDQQFEVVFDRELEALEEFLKPEKQYVALARQLTENFLMSIEKRR